MVLVDDQKKGVVEAYIGTPDYEAAADLAGFDLNVAVTHGEVRAIVDAALAGTERIELTEETNHHYVCCAKAANQKIGAPRHDPEIETERRWVSGWVPVTGDKT